MTLVMPLADPSYAAIETLMQEVFDDEAETALTAALDAGGTVHFARFVVIDGNLVMASSYDGDFGDYIQMFVHMMGDAFNQVMGFVVDPAPTPVQEHPDAFVDWVQAHNVESLGFYSAYPGVSAVQIRDAFDVPGRQQPPVPAPEPLALDPAQLPDIQGIILRGPGQSMVRHLVLRVLDGPAARRTLGVMATPGGDGPKVTHGADWGDDKPSTCIAVGVTATGLVALGVPTTAVGTFPTDFLEGAVERAPKVGDWDLNAPEQWGPLADADAVHLLVSVYASGRDDLEASAAAVLASFGSSCSTVTSFDGAVFADDVDAVHFGYRDNISQPLIDGDPVPSRPDGPQDTVPPGEFLLGYESQFSGVTLDVPQPAALGVNGSFTAFRVLEQNVVGFETFLETVAADLHVDKELVAAKIVGRWRNGIPLTLAPGPTPPPDPGPDDGLNDFGYAADDAEGERCPIGSHIRRANPRDQAMLPQGDNGRRRLMRRGMPYGPEWHAGDPPDDIARGLLGHFIGASLTLQFETVLGEWVDVGMADPSITGTNDVLIGVHQKPNTFRVPVEGGGPPIEIPVDDLQFTSTKGSIYAFLPSLTALRWIAALPVA